MLPKELIIKWMEIFNQADAAALADLYNSSAINPLVNFVPVEGKDAIKKNVRRGICESKNGVHY